MAYAKEGEFSRALECYKQALEKDPTNIDAMVAAGAAHANQQDFQAAMCYFDNALGMLVIVFKAHLPCPSSSLVCFVAASAGASPANV